MFERRLRILLILLVLPALGIVLRLLQLQIVDAAQYRDETQHLLLKPVVYSPFLRGEITDHDGHYRLAYDAPAWNICVQYRLLAGDEQYLHNLRMKRYRGMDSDDAREALQRDIDASWRSIAQVSGQTLDERSAGVQKIIRDVTKVKQYVQRKRGVPTVVVEEDMAHAVVRGLDQPQQALAREQLRSYEWVSVVSDQRRLYAGGAAVGQLIGPGLGSPSCLAEVGPEDIVKKNYADTPLGELYEYVSGDFKGIGGVEMMGERWLRGHRGRLRKDVEGRVVDDPPPADAENGKCLHLTIDLPLQQTVYEILARAVKAYPYSTGGAAVILDVPSREILAIVSVPSYDPNITPKEWAELAEDELHQPLVFRPLQMHYPPGSTVKPMLLAGALTDGTVTRDTHVNCQKHLFPGRPDLGFGCTGWHGDTDPLKAIQHSCNIFFYKLGEEMARQRGIERLAWWMSQFGFGRDTGSNFPREAAGNLPKKPGIGNAREAAIGQAEVDATPLQVANMMAAMASGVYRPVTLQADDPTPRPATRLPIADAAWRLAREGMYKVVNTTEGTASKHGQLKDAGDYILIGKTGSATGRRHVLQRKYVCHLTDGRTIEEVSSRRELERKYPGATLVPGMPTGYCPPEGIDPTHAWFAGYLTTKQHYLDSNNAGRLNVAIAVIVEFAGHGGDAAAPVARRMIRAVLERAGEVAPAPDEDPESESELTAPAEGGDEAAATTSPAEAGPPTTRGSED